MNKIETLIKDIEDGEKPVSSLLRRAKVMALELESDEIVEWIENELDGYQKDEKVPEYRMITGTPQILNPYRGWIPFVHENDEAQRGLSRLGNHQSVAVLEDAIKSADESGLALRYPHERARLMTEAFKEDTGVDTNVRLKIETSQVKGVLSKIRSRLLNHVVKIKNKSSDTNSEKIQDSHSYLDTDSVNVGVVKNLQIGDGEIIDGDNQQSSGWSWLLNNWITPIIVGVIIIAIAAYIGIG